MEPAFPGTEIQMVGNSYDGMKEVKRLVSGLTKREYAAIMAMQGLLACTSLGLGASSNAIATTAVLYADALLTELSKGDSSK